MPEPTTLSYLVVAALLFVMGTVGVMVSEKRWLSRSVELANSIRLTCLATLGVLLGVAPSSVTEVQFLSVKPATEKGVFTRSASNTMVRLPLFKVASRPLLVSVLTLDVNSVSTSLTVRTLSW